MSRDTALLCAWITALFGWAATLLPATAAALEADDRQQIEIRADRWWLDDRTGLAHFEGQVLVTQGSRRTEGDTLVVTYDEKGEVERLVVEGNPARFRMRPEGEESDVTGAARTIRWLQAKQRVILLGEAHLEQADSHFSSERIVYDLSREKVVAGGDEGDRVHIVIQPKLLEKGRRETTPATEGGREKP